ncbi:hypothetical protein [Synechococcus sp. PCC 7336]|uniref:hypothetical protein n=1 Tax=Synechococcus sp. PCC 7336 TaxID=195250 RepID=UPI00034DD508|nr:hypothetical protein [Synechococcus sp. PCC 7336]
MNRFIRRLRRSRLLTVLLLVAIAWGFGWSLGAQETISQPDLATRHRLGAEVYVETCGACHTALPPQVMPADTWRSLLQSPNHYGLQLENLPRGPLLQATWAFMRDFSRNRGTTEPIPYRLSNSRFFNALHPDVEFPGEIRATGCITCHPRANLGEFTSLTAAWQ